MSRKKTTKEFIEDAIELYGYKYDYSKVEYNGNKVKVIINCPEHGDFEQRPNDHLVGYGCKQCGYKIVSKKVSEAKQKKYRTLDEWKDFISKRYNLELLSIDGELGVRNGTMTIKCNKHNIEFQTSNEVALKAKMLCPICVKMNHQIQTSTNTNDKHVYLKYIPSIKMFKLGVSSNVKNRNFTKNDITIWQHKMNSKDALEFEHWIHNEYEEFRYSKTDKLIKTGNTELYETHDLSDLDLLLKSYRDSIAKAIV